MDSRTFSVSLRRLMQVLNDPLVKDMLGVPPGYDVVGLPKQGRGGLQLSMDLKKSRKYSAAEHGSFKDRVTCAEGLPEHGTPYDFSGAPHGIFTGKTVETPTEVTVDEILKMRESFTDANYVGLYRIETTCNNDGNLIHTLVLSDPPYGRGWDDLTEDQRKASRWLYRNGDKTLRERLAEIHGVERLTMTVLTDVPQEPITTTPGYAVCGKKFDTTDDPCQLASGHPGACRGY